MTIEDPVEYVFPAVNQMQINLQADVTFATGLKSILRQDPDVILVGEIRDQETARHRRAVGPDRSPRDVVAARHRRQLGAVPPVDMGIEPFLVVVVARRRRRPAARAPDLRGVRRAVRPRPERAAPGTAYLGGPEKDTLRPRHRVQLLLAHRLPRPGRRLRGARRDRRDPQGAGPRRQPAATSATRRSTRACARWATRRWRSSPRTSPRSTKSSATSTSPDATAVHVGSERTRHEAGPGGV